MANDDDLSFKVTADGSEARREISSVYDVLRKLSPVAEAAGKSLDEVGSGGLKDLQNYATTLERVDALLDNMETRQARNAATRSKSESSSYLSTSNAVYGDDTNQSKAALAAQKVLNAEAQKEVMLRQQANKDIESESRLTLNNAQIERVANQQRIDNLREADRQAKSLAQTEASAARAAQRAEEQRRAAILERAKTERSSALAAERAAQTEAMWAANPGATGRRSAATSNPHDVSEINATRYALYDVAQTATVVGTAIAGIGAGAIAAATQAQSAFADVQRAMDVPYDQAVQLRGELMDLTTSMPTSFTDVAGVAQLGAQLGVANDDLDDFTTSVVKFAATTDVSTEAAATAFGRLGQLLDVPASQFENLSSSIYQVGIDSVATESEIISTSTQIAGAASAYNFTADQVVGLSAAFASLGIAPEAARGSVTRIFGDIEKAVGAGGKALEPFNRLLGMTEEQTTALWKNRPAEFFSELVKGLSQSKNLLGDLSSIGANDVRDINLLQRLSTNSDFLAKSLKTAKTAYDDGTATSKGYAITAETLAAKLQELVNTFLKLADAAGGPLLGVLGGAVDVLKQFLNSLSNANPFVLGLVTALTLVVGGFVLLRAAQAAAMAGILALRFVIQQLGETAGTTGINLGSLKTQLALLRTELGATTAQARGADAALAATGDGAVKGGKGMQFMSAAGKAIGFASLILLAGQFTGAILEANRASINAAQGINQVSNAAAGAKLSMADVTESFKQAKNQVYEFQGGNLTDVLANALGSATGMTDYVKQAQQEIGAIDDRLAKLVSDGNPKEAAQQVKEFGISANEVSTLLPNYSAALDQNAGAVRSQSEAVKLAQGDNTDYASALDTAKQAVDGLFTSLNSQSDFASSIQQLFSGIYDAGNSFSYLSEAGRTNLSNLQDSMAQTIAYGQSLGLSATNSIALLFSQLQKQGIDTDSLLRVIASQPYLFSADIDISKVQAKLAAIGKGAQPSSLAKNTAAFSSLNGMLGNLAITAPKATTGLSGTGGAAKKAGKAASEAAKEVKTLNDYASDLSTVFNDARTYRFGVQDALDDIAGKWVSINKEIADNNDALAEHKKDIADARNELAKYRADLSSLQAQLSTQKYFLKIAIQYGDTLRAGEINGDIADLTQQLADKQRDVNQAQADANAPYQSTTKSQLDQRQTLGDLYEAYEKAIAEYARSGMTQDQLRVKVDALRADFVKQATQAGYSKAEINRYANAFRDMTVAINGVPRKITVTANTDPAFRALNDFLAKANKAKANPSVDSPGAGAAGARAAQSFQAGFAQTMANIKSIQRSIDNTLANINIPDFSKLNADIARTLRQASGHADGGFVKGKNAFPIGGYVPGNAPSDRRKDNTFGIVAGGGIVGLQGGEPIMTNAARSKYGDQMFNDINALRYSPQVVRPQVNVQGGGGGMIELSPYDRQLLIDIRNSSGIVIPATAIQQAANAGNTSSSRRRVG